MADENANTADLTMDEKLDRILTDQANGADQAEDSAASGGEATAEIVEEDCGWEGHGESSIKETQGLTQRTEQARINNNLE